MSKKQLIKDYLESEPRFRERVNKDRGIVNLLLRHQSLKMPPEPTFLTKELLITICQDYASLDRFWRMLLMECPELRGSDYDSKDKMESEHLVNLGYHAPSKVGEGEAVEEDNQPTLL